MKNILYTLVGVIALVTFPLWMVGLILYLMLWLLHDIGKDIIGSAKSNLWGYYQ